MSKIDTLSIEKQRAIEALTTSGNVAEAARVADCSRKTIYRWLQEPGFARALESVARENLSNLTREVVGLGTMAVITLSSAMSDKEVAAGTKVRAADIVLSRLLQLREMVNLESRLVALEEKVFGKH